ncbi:2-succinyl-6-hydroxy-2,4-cyclohexadiene-1-carboxylate synthase [Granulosicoccus antarcticus IMCC3135]|uniref:2-succinyl-6-hydroxy-2, 4-cyclohexadiene-1-carboxylate synthase n=1 Tax=Granulosicoccus antarcticus IMCC3135 TaxID=1192854 RepID=A0A2Z2P400_9GAMM|nr:2-succinyl-6-hydroxy-2,4-cyclohexadiene-1-carboxylate synthase [Granulosicoccus antarcticus IMCC3135]
MDDQSGDKPDWIHARIALQTDRGAQLVLHHVCPAQDSETVRKADVLLAHGTFSNYRTCSGLARYLAERGHACWLIDFEGHGCSSKVQPEPDFEELFLSGTLAALEYVEARGDGKVHWVGHSGGGLAALMAVARKPELTSQLHSLVMLGSQACDAAKPFTHRMTLRMFQLLTRMLGYVPARALRLGPENEVAAVMLQWYRWNLQGGWQGRNNFDYLQALQKHPTLSCVPVLGLAGSGDRFIAPAPACRKLHALLPGVDNVWQECGLSENFAEDYTHSRLISSRPAAREIWPKVADWLASVESR